MPIVIPKIPAEAMERLHRSGIPAWVVGGAVRDSLLGRPAGDWDLTVACMPDRLAEAMPDAVPIGGQYGTVSWHGVEITPCRAEAGYTDHRHPDEICFGGTLADDLARRDFTVNAIAYDGKTITDPYHGQEDIRNHILRAVGEPEVRFGEDALRILRLYRFAGTLDFSIDPATEAAAEKLAPTLSAVSAQRVRGELNKAMHGASVFRLGPLIAAGGLAAFGFSPERLKQYPDNLRPVCSVPDSVLCRWWTLLHQTGADAHKCAEVFDFGRSFVRDYARMDDMFDAGCPADRHALKLALLNPPPFPFEDAAETFAAVSGEFRRLPEMYADLKASGEAYRKEQLAITAPELLVEGVPGRRIGKVQKCLLKAVIDTPEMNNYSMLAQMARSLKKMV